MSNHTRKWARHLERLRGPGARRARLGKPSASLAALTRRLPKGSTVIDVGCGESGDQSVGRERGYRVFGLDLFPPSRKRRNFIQANAIDLPFRADSFDGAVCHAMVALLSPDERWQMFREIARVLKPRGLLAVAVYPLADGFNVPKAIEDQRIFDSGLHRAGSGVYMKCAIPDCEEHPDPDSWEAIMRGVKLIDNNPRFIETASKLIAWVVKGGSPSEAAEFARVDEAEIRKVIDGAEACGIFDRGEGSLHLPWLTAYTEDRIVEGNISLVLDVLAIRGEIERINDGEGLRYRAKQKDAQTAETADNVRPFKTTRAA